MFVLQFLGEPHVGVYHVTKAIQRNDAGFLLFFVKSCCKKMAKPLYMADLGSSMLPMLGKFQSWFGSFLHKHMAVQLVIFLTVDEKKIHNKNKKMQPPLANFLEGFFGEHIETRMDATILTIAQVFFINMLYYFAQLGAGKPLS